ncbi:TIGR01777 family oxidoreductase [Kribbella sp. CA-293567]|uniref:TIGR01777 family oxidoreductase n=1 Tax=Kribbella sp. CA-293567 TaxID=3002436 RepID=UPI0022DE05EE|nr:TIGR01777 family oxidoreductase [Kribbella sp. CA-293567]WBQ08249.1 TIGR01777 family oxidoreductase [Kribbella sp. CA-293567]
MGLTSSAVVEAPRPEVFAWFQRPGAIVRLTPPWMPVRIKREATDLADGTAVLGFPLGLDWVARHSGAVAPAQFVDELDSAPLRWLVHWRHTHDFEEVPPNRTRVIDRIDSNVPAVMLRSMLAYRHRQLADDLAARDRAIEAGMRPLTVAMTGSHGTIGTALAALLTTNGHRVIRLVRGQAEGPDERRWDVETPDANLLQGVDAVIHLAGASIAGRFTPEHRKAVRDSRIGPTRQLARLAAETTDGPQVFVSASAIGYYGPDRGDEPLTEGSSRGDGFLASLVEDWEQATEPAAAAGLRVVNVRTGLAQTPAGGVLQLQYPLFAAGLGGPLGDGQQWQAWIGIDDLADIYHRCLYDADLSGPINAAAPEPVRNDEYSATLARVLHRPALLRVPALGPRLILGKEGTDELALASQRVLPRRLTDLGHTFRHPDLESALRHLLGRPVKAG